MRLSKSLRLWWPRTLASLRHPVRRTHVIWRWVEGYVGGLALEGALLAYLNGADWWLWSLMFQAPTIVALLLTAPVIVPCAEFVWYEFLIEPLSKRRARRGKTSLAGPYFERGPQDDEPWVW